MSLRPVSDEAAAIHDAALIIDLHCDLLLPTHFFGWDWGKHHRNHPIPGAPLFGHVDLPRLKAGNVGVVALGVVVNPWWGAPRHIGMDLDRMANEVATHADDLVLAGSAADIRAAKAAGKIACFAGLEGAHALRGSLDDLPDFHRRGLRYVGLVHFTRNEACRPMAGWGTSRTEGLTAYGHDLIAELGRLNMVVDLAHANKPAFMEACKTARRPMLCSHTACTAIHRSPRGIDDDMLRAIADVDGVVGVIFVPPFIGPGGAAQAARHLDHIKRTIGIRHCALGSDWEGFAIYPADLNCPSRLGQLTQALMDIGWSAEHIHAAYGENTMRVLAAVTG